MPHLLSHEDYGGPEGINLLLDRATVMEERLATPRHFLPTNVVVGLLFSSQSTRTRNGFATSASRIGVWSREIGEFRGSNAQSGDPQTESVEDTALSLAPYYHGFVIRDPNPSVAQTFALHTKRPVINGGDVLHPTQTLIDMYAMRKHPYVRDQGSFDGVIITAIGSLNDSRSMKSLLDGLNMYDDVVVQTIAPDDLDYSQDEKTTRWPKVAFRKIEKGDLGNEHFVYVAGFPETPIYPKGSPILQAHILTHEDALRLHEEAMILCPLPIMDEIEYEVRHLPAAGYFDPQNMGSPAVRATIFDHYVLSEYGLSIAF